MTSFLDLRPSSSPRSSLSSPSSRPHTSSVTLTPAPSGDDDNVFVSRQLPLMSSSITVPASPPRPRHHHRASTHSPKRLSVFGSRSRSNTAASTSSSYKSPASSMTSGSSSSHRSSQDSRGFAPFVAPPEKQESRTRSLLVRGSRILRRRGSKFSISANLTVEEEDEMGKHLEKSRDADRRDGLGLFQRHRSRHSDTHGSLKHSISDPFNFQHVTHTNPGQLPPLEVTHPHDLATEFSILRAAQRPKAELKGIRAENLIYRDPVTEDSVSILAPDSQSLFTRSPPTSPKAPSSPPPFRHGFSPRASRSVENFSRPVSRTRKTSCPSITPPPRGSSRFAGSSDIPEPTSQTVDALLGLHSPTTFPEHVPSRTEPMSPRSPGPLAAPFNYDACHAFTTEDDFARPLRSPHAHTPDLADVPEEDESSWRNSSVLKSPPPPSPPAQEFTTSGYGSGRRPEFGTPLQNTAPFLEVPRGSEALHSPTIPPKQMELPPRPASRPGKGWNNQPQSHARESLDDSWEDYIDYCYEHAAESNSNFDWQRTSSEEQRVATENFATLTINPSSPVEEKQQQIPQVTVGLQAPSVVVSGKSTPELSAISCSTQVSTVSTAPTENPFDFIAVGSPKQSNSLEKPGRIQVHPSFDDHVSPDAYEDMMHEEGQYALYTHPEDNYRSSRGSGSQLSKCNSQESMILSRAASIARKHRSSVSTTSVPELVHSSSCSHDTGKRDSGFSDPPRALSPRAPSAASHWRSKTLTQEFSHIGGESSLPSTPNHDRTRSVSALESQDSLSSIQSIPQSATRIRASTITRGGTRKARTSYSLFPTAAPPQSK